MENEITSHPPRYNREGRKECIDEMVDIFGLDYVVMWCAMTCYKYLYRCGLKDSVEQELAKVKWYEEWIEKHENDCRILAKLVVLEYRNAKEKMNG